MSDTYDPGDYTVEEVKEYVTDNPDQADEVLAAEQAGKNRTTLTDWLESQQAQPQLTDEPPPEESPDQPVPVEVTPEEQSTPQLPPTLAEAGLVGVIGVTAGQYSTPSGSFFAISPGQAYVTSGDDATALVEQGAAAKIDDSSAG